MKQEDIKDAAGIINNILEQPLNVEGASENISLLKVCLESIYRKPSAHKDIRFCKSQKIYSGRQVNWHKPIRILVNEI